MREIVSTEGCNFDERRERGREGGKEGGREGGRGGRNKETTCLTKGGREGGREGGYVRRCWGHRSLVECYRRSSRLCY